jgi:hypothetical protein
MRWSVLSCVLFASIGCQQPSSLDPFSAYGPTTITPPPTGTAGRPDPYYRKSLSSNPRYGPSAQTVFTSEQNPGPVEVADQRSDIQASLNDSTSKVQWRSPVNDRYTNDLPSSEVVGSGRARPRIPSNRRLGHLSSNSVDEPVILNQNLVGASNGLDAYQGLAPTPPADRQVAPAAFQQPVQSGAGWQTRY